MRTIAVVNQKGGCGKTTVSINLASALAELGQRTLLVDMDPQSHCAVGLAVPEEQIEQSIYDVLISKSRNEPIKLTEILWQIGDNLEMAPANIDLSAFEQQMTGVSERECCLKNVLEEVASEFDYVVIDCPPAVGLLTFNALRASTDVVVPVETGYFSLHGLSKQLETLNILCERCSQLVNVRVLASMYDIRTKMAREILAELRTHFADKMLKTTVNFNTKLKEAASFGQPISEYEPASKGQKDFRALAQEVIDSESRQQRRELVNSLASQLEAIGSTADELLLSAKPAIKTIEPLKTETAKAAINIVEPLKTKTAKPAIQAVEALKAEKSTPAIATMEAPKAETAKPMDIDAKLSDYYGVSQINDAVVFVTLYPRAESVQIAGDFNGWQPEEAPLLKVGQSGVWQTKLKLPAGKYRYRLVVDGQWQQDPYNEQTELNPFGGFNSVVEVT
ncbi:MAG: AAA family ATPase [Planctomycetota bacterium]|jgi:chromosome partitioning protein